MSVMAIASNVRAASLHAAIVIVETMEAIRRRWGSLLLLFSVAILIVIGRWVFFFLG